MEYVVDPEVQEALIQTATSAASGNWMGALWGVGATFAAVAGHTTYKKAKQKGGVSTPS